MLTTLLIVTSIATSSTGGNSVGPGGVVRVGESHSSAEVRTILGGSGTTSIRIETSTNGERRILERTVPARSGSVQQTVVATSSRSTANSGGSAAAVVTAQTAPNATTSIPTPAVPASSVAQWVQELVTTILQQLGRLLGAW